jgi:hypothetical protein
MVCVVGGRIWSAGEETVDQPLRLPVLPTATPGISARLNEGDAGSSAAALPVRL